MHKDMLEVALLGKTNGLKGAIKLHNRSDFVSQFKKGAKFYLENGEILEILSFNKANFTAIFRGFESIELAKTLTNKKIFQTKEMTKKTCKLAKDEFFYFEILGLEIVENGEILGVVSDILEVANFIFEISTAGNLKQSGLPEIFYLPYIDHFIERVDVGGGKIFAKGAKEILQNS